MAYKVKRGSTPTDMTIKEMLISFFKRLIVVMIILALMVVLGYFLFQYTYNEVPVFAEAADDAINWLKFFYSEHGIWATIGLIVFVCVAVWAFG